MYFVDPGDQNEDPLFIYVFSSSFTKEMTIFIHTCVFSLPALNKKRVQSIWQLSFKRRT